jgi:acetylornithine deacetylase
MTETSTRVLPEETVRLVTDAVDAVREDLIALLQDLIRIPSENPKLANSSPNGESNLQDRVAVEMDAIGAVMDRWDALPGRPNLVGTLKGSGGGRSLALNSHIDTVPAGNADEWTHEPFSGDIDQGAVWGRGSVDPKGGVAAFLFVARLLIELDFRLKGDLFLEAVVDEETGGPGTRSTIERGYRPDFALVVDAAESIEKLIVTEGGLEWLRVTVTGVSGHSAARYMSVHAGGQGTAVSAFDKAVKIVNAVAELERMWAVRKVHPLLPKGITTINVGAMTAGSGGGANGVPSVMTSVSSLPDYCAIDLSLKYLPTESTAAVREEFETYIHYVCQADDWLRNNPPTIEWGLHGVSFPPSDIDPGHDAITTMANVLDVLGLSAELVGFAGVSDIAWFAEAGIPSSICGPGKAYGVHGIDERIDIDSLVESVKAIALFTLAWCGYDRKE